jgi:hypothetical protein
VGGRSASSDHEPVVPAARPCPGGRSKTVRRRLQKMRARASAGGGTGGPVRQGQASGWCDRGCCGRFPANDAIAVRLGTQVVGAHSTGRLKHLTLHDTRTGSAETVPRQRCSS